MKYITVLLTMLSMLQSSVLESTILSVDKAKNTATINIQKIDVGMSGFVVKHFDKDHSSIIRNVVVERFVDGVATLKLNDFVDFENTALPSGRWSVQKGDTAIFAFGYSKALFIAPSVEIYNKITRGTQHMQWLHPDIFAAILSINAHPTPLKEDFDQLSSKTYIGLVFIYLNAKIYTVDVKTFKILNTLDVALEQKSEQLPFYSRVEEIDAAWFGKGSEELKDYEPHYYELLIKYNPKDKRLKKSYEAYKQKQIKG